MVATLTSHYSDGSVQVYCMYMVTLRAELEYVCVFDNKSQLTCFTQVLWELCGFPAASLTGDHQEAAVSDSLN